MDSVCPSCHGPNPAGMRFCGHCGAPLISRSSPSGPPGTALQEDRRLVTILFCDLVGFTPLAEQLDPEELREIQDAYFARMSAEIARYGGMVEKYAGDAVLAIFGAPVAHEDDSERAICCALDMRRALEPLATDALERFGADLALRIGINTGEVVSGPRQVEGRLDYTVTGDAVNTASRFQTAAQPGGVMVGLETMLLARRNVLFGERQELQLKGKSAPVPAYPVRGLRERMAERWEIVQDRTPFVGRDQELEELLESWRQVREGRGQIISLEAEAGVGKSRLLAEAVERITLTDPVLILRARCLSYTQEASLWLVADLLRSLMGVRHQDPPERPRAQVAESVDALLGSEDEQTRAMAVDVLGETLGLSVEDSPVANADARVRRQVLVRSLRLLLCALAERGPSVVALEDLHWMDAASREVLVEILPAITDLPVFVVATRRPDRRGPLPEWSWVRSLHLQPLAGAAIPALARAVLGGETLSADLERSVRERSGGNPFFVEELLRNLQESGALRRQDGEVHVVEDAAERLPATLSGLLLARLDGLDREARSLAQVGSVVGRQFALRVLAHVTALEVERLRPPLAELERAALLLPRWSGELEYVFRHAAVQEVAYQTLLLRRRQELHAAVARALIALYPGDELMEIIAYHYARSREWLEAADWLERSGDRSADVYANDAALSRYDDARRRLELHGTEPERLAGLDEKRARVLGRTGQYDRALQAAERAIEVYRRLGDLDALGRVTALAGQWHGMRGTSQQGLSRVRATIELLAESSSAPSLALLQSALARISLSCGSYREGLEAAEQAARLARSMDAEGHPESSRILAQAEMIRGTLWGAMGRMENCRQVLQEARSLAESSGDMETLGRVLTNLGEVHLKLGELSRSRDYLEEAIAVLERVGEPGAAGWLHLAMTLTYLGEWDRAREAIERGEASIRALGISRYAPYGPLLRGQLHLLKGRWEEAGRELATCVDLAEPTGDLQVLQQAHWFLAQLDLLNGQPAAARARLTPLVAWEAGYEVGVLATLAEAHLALGDLGRAEEAVMKGLVVGTARQHRLFLADALRVQAVLMARQRRWEEARTVFEAAASLARDMASPYAEARTRREYGMMHVQREERPEAREQLQEALAMFRGLGAERDIEEMEQTLAALNHPAA